MEIEPVRVSVTYDSDFISYRSPCRLPSVMKKKHFFGSPGVSFVLKRCLMVKLSLIFFIVMSSLENATTRKFNYYYPNSCLSFPRCHWPKFPLLHDNARSHRTRIVNELLEVKDIARID